MKKILLLLFIVPLLSHAASFDTTGFGRGFTYDSAATVRIFTETSDCSVPRMGCLLRITDDLGEGISVNIYGPPKDTVEIKPTFTRTLLPSTSHEATLTFFDAAGKERASKTVPMGFADIKPPTLIIRPGIPKGRFMRSLAGFRIDGRAKP